MLLSAAKLSWRTRNTKYSYRRHLFIPNKNQPSPHERQEHSTTISKNTKTVNYPDTVSCTYHLFSDQQFPTWAPFPPFYPMEKGFLRLPITEGEDAPNIVFPPSLHICPPPPTTNLLTWEKASKSASIIWPGGGATMFGHGITAAAALSPGRQGSFAYGR